MWVCGGWRACNVHTEHRDTAQFMWYGSESGADPPHHHRNVLGPQPGESGGLMFYMGPFDGARSMAARCCWYTTHCDM